MSTVTVGIIGGGLVGCSAALHLRKRGASVVLFERRTCGSQASGVNYGGVRQQGRHMTQLPLARRSREIWSQLPALIGTDGEFLATGHLKLARSDDDMEELARYAEEASAHGLRLELLDERQLRREYPWLSSTVVGGSLCAEDGHANPRIVSPAFARAAMAAGADIVENCSVRSATKEGDEFLIQTDRAQYRVSVLVNAAGAWGNEISSWFDEPVPEAVIAPNMCVTEPLPYFLLPNLGVCGAGIYVRQIPRGNVIFGAGHGVANRKELTARPSAEVTTRGAALAVGLVPRLAHAQLIRTWTGIEGLMPDRLPVVDISRTTPNLIHAFGFSGHGFQIAPAVGAVVAELVMDGKTPTPIESFAINRPSLVTQTAEPSLTADLPGG
jgi:sarcosine oxidase subunit beta